MSDPEPKIVNLPAPEVIWSLAVKARDEKCVCCDSKDELVAYLFDGRGIVSKDGTLDLSSGVALCARCNLRAGKDAKFREGLPGMLKPIKAARLNIEIDGSLHARFQAVCRYRGTTVSRAVRELITAHMEVVEDVGRN